MPSEVNPLLHGLQLNSHRTDELLDLCVANKETQSYRMADRGALFCKSCLKVFLGRLEQKLKGFDSIVLTTVYRVPYGKDMQENTHLHVTHRVCMHKRKLRHRW